MLYSRDWHNIVNQLYFNFKIKLKRDSYEQLYINKFDNLEEMEKFLEAYNVPRLNHEKNIANLAVKLNQKSKTSQNQKPDSFTGEFYEAFKEVIPILPKLF